MVEMWNETYVTITGNDESPVCKAVIQGEQNTSVCIKSVEDAIALSHKLEYVAHNY